MELGVPNTNVQHEEFSKVFMVWREPVDLLDGTKKFRCTSGLNAWKEETMWGWLSMYFSSLRRRSGATRHDESRHGQQKKNVSENCRNPDFYVHSCVQTIVDGLERKHTHTKSLLL